MTLLHAVVGAPQTAGFLGHHSQVVCVLFAFGFFPYSVSELISSWLLFAAFFVAVTVLIFTAVLTFHGVEFIIRWARTASRATGKVDVAVPIRLR